MRKIVLAILAAVLLCAQTPMLPGFPPGTFQNRAALDAAGGGGAYTGPGDVISYSTGAYYGLMAYNSATRGNKLVNVCNSTGGVDVGCADLSSSASTGHLVSATISGITCPGANCTIKIYYDLTGGNQCSAASCDATQATVASRDTLGTSCAPLSVSVCATSAGGVYLSTSGFSFSAPTFLSAGANALSSTGNQQDLIGAGSNNQLIGFFSTTLAPFVTGDGLATHLQTTGGYGAYHGIAGLANGASSYIALDSSVTTGTLGFGASGAVMAIHGDTFGQNLPAGSLFLEGGIALASPSSATAQSLNANVKTRWGF